MRQHASSRMPTPSSRTPTPRVAVNVHCANCDAMLGTYENSWVRITNSYMMPKGNGPQFEMQVSKESRPVPDSQQNTLIDGCRIAEASCQHCRKSFGQFCTGAASETKVGLIGRTFYRQPRIYLVDYLTAKEVTPKLDTEDNPQYSAPPNKSNLSELSPMPRHDEAYDWSHPYPSGSRATSTTANQRQLNGVPGTSSGKSSRQMPLRDQAALSAAEIYPSFSTRSAPSNLRIENAVNRSSKRLNGQAEPIAKRRRLASNTSEDISQTVERPDSLEGTPSGPRVDVQDVDKLIAARLEAMVENLRGDRVMGAEEVQKLRQENQILKKRLEMLGTLLDSRLSKPKTAQQVKPNEAPISSSKSTTGKRKGQLEPSTNRRSSRLRKVDSTGSLRRTSGIDASASRLSNGKRLTCAQMQPFGQCGAEINACKSPPVEGSNLRLNRSIEDHHEPQLKIDGNEANETVDRESNKAMSSQGNDIAEFSDEQELPPQPRPPSVGSESKHSQLPHSGSKVRVPPAPVLTNQAGKAEGYQLDTDSSSKRSVFYPSGAAEDTQEVNEKPPPIGDEAKEPETEAEVEANGPVPNPNPEVVGVGVNPVVTEEVKIDFPPQAQTMLEPDSKSEATTAAAATATSCDAIAVPDFSDEESEAYTVPHPRRHLDLDLETLAESQPEPESRSPEPTAPHDTTAAVPPLASERTTPAPAHTPLIDSSMSSSPLSTPPPSSPALLPTDMSSSDPLV